MHIGEAAGRLATAAVVGLIWLAPAVGATEAPVTECDRLAADPEDPQRPDGVDGVWWPGGGDYVRAIAACEEAVARYPDAPRFRYQRARVILLWSRDCDLVLPELEAVAAGGYAAAADLIADCYGGVGPWGITPDVGEARQWRLKAVELGSRRARLAIAKLVGHGAEGYRKDEAWALREVMDLADEGDTRAMLWLWEMYTFGHWWVEKDINCAIAFLTRAAERGNPTALYRLAKEYLKPRPEMERYLPRARTLMARAAASGHERAREALPALEERLGATPGTRLPHARRAEAPPVHPAIRERVVCNGRVIWTP